MRGLLHIGMPKCMSTSIQAWLREAAHVHFMGIGSSRLVKPEVLLAFQRQLVRTPTQFYDSEFVAGLFRENMKQARSADAEIFALSDETIPFPLGYARADTSYYERMQRLRAVMPQNTRVLIVTRRPFDYLKSTYKYRTVMNGMNLSFEEYLKRLLLLGDSNLLGTIKFYFYAEAAKQIFGGVDVVAMEDNERALLDLLGAPRTGDPAKRKLPRENSGMPGVKFANFRDLHAAFGDTLADDDFNVLSPADKKMTQLNPAYFGSVLGAAFAKEQTLTSLRNLAVSMPDRPKDLCFEISDETRKRLMEYTAEANAMLHNLYGVDVAAYDYDGFA